MAAKKKQVKKAKKPTMRELAKTGDAPTKAERIRRLTPKARKIAAPLRFVGKVAKKLRIRLPDNRFGRVLRRIGRIIGQILFLRFFREAWTEIRQVTWPTRRETIRLSVAVFIFSIIFGTIVALLDYGLDKLFKEVIIK